LPTNTERCGIQPDPQALAALDAATSRASYVDRSLAVGLAEILHAQRKLARATDLLQDAAILHGSNPKQRFT